MKTTTRLEPPDGGWGIIVCIGVSIPMMCIFGPLSSFGLIFNDFLKERGSETSSVTLITNIFFWGLSFGGLFTGAISKLCSLRTIGLLGSVVFVMGSIMQLYVETVFGLTMAFGVAQGFAAGLLLATSYSSFNAYFVKKRVMMMGVCKMVMSIGLTFYPVLIQKLIDTYGFRGSLLILVGINSHIILGMLVCQPVELHMKKVEINDEDNIDAEKDNPNPEPKPLLTTEKSASQNSLDLRLDDRLPKKMGSYVSLSTRTSNCTVPVEKQTIRKENSYWQVILDILDLSFLKDPFYVNICLGVSLSLFSDVTFSTIHPLYLFELNYTKMEAAEIISIGAGADMISRLLLTLIAYFITVSPRAIFLAGGILTFLLRFAFLEVTDFTYMAIVTAMLGFLRTWIHVTMPLVFGEYLPRERFASGYGLFMFLHGNITFLVGPIMGFIRDKTKDYIITFHFLNACLAVCVVPWLIEIVYLKCRKNKRSKDVKDIEMK